MPLPIDYDFSEDTTLRCKGIAGTDMAKYEGEYFGNFMVNNQVWAIILWDHEEDPDLYKADLILIEKKTWVPIRL